MFKDILILSSTYKKLLLTIIFGICLSLSLYLLFINLGHAPLENWDEAFYAQNTKEMLHTKDIVVLHWDYKVWLEKPPMYIWISAITSLFIGLTELSARLPSAISAFLIVAITSFYVYKKYSLIPSLFTFFTLILNNIFIWRARSGNIDLFASLLILISFFLLLSKNKNRYICLGIIFAFTFLTKASLVAFPFLVFVLNEIFFQRKYLKQNLKDYFKLLAIFIGISGFWLFLGYLEVGTKFLTYYLFQSDQGVATLSKFNVNYLLHTYYALQRRLFWVFLFGIALCFWKIKKQNHFLLIMYSLLLLLQLSFTAKDNNWYLTPAMPFWSIIIGMAIYSILKFVGKNKIFYAGTIIGLITISSYISYKTLFVNIMPILNSSSTIDQTESAKKISLLTKKSDTIVRLDPLIPNTLYYSNRFTLAYSPDTNTHGYWIDTKDLTAALKTRKIQWLVGTNTEIDKFLKNFSTQMFEKIQVNNTESILKVK